MIRVGKNNRDSPQHDLSQRVRAENPSIEDEGELNENARSFFFLRLQNNVLDLVSYGVTDLYLERSQG